MSDATPYKNVVVERKEGEKVLLVTLNRPKALNALNAALMTELIDVCEKADANPQVSCIVLTGEATYASINQLSDCSGAEFLRFFPRRRKSICGRRRHQGNGEQDFHRYFDDILVFSVEMITWRFADLDVCWTDAYKENFAATWQIVSHTRKPIIAVKNPCVEIIRSEQEKKNLTVKTC